MAITSMFSVLGLACTVVAQQCPLQFDGRVRTNGTTALFDTSASPFNPSFTVGKNTTFGKSALLPDVEPSLFDVSTGAVELTISDDSIFAPSETNVQVGFRRIEFMPASNNGTDPSTAGIKTLHFSVMKDTTRPLNTSHEYQLVFLESNDFSTNQFALKTGTIGGQPTGQDPNLLVLVSNVNGDKGNLFSTDFTADVWHNFALTLDFTKNTTEVLYSTDCAALTSVTAALPNNLSGQGQYHFGILKKPTGEGLTDVAKQGFQSAGINEGVIFGGIFQEDSTGGCVSLSIV